MSSFLIVVVASLIVGFVGMLFGAISANVNDKNFDGFVVLMLWGFIIGFSMVWCVAIALFALIWADRK